MTIHESLADLEEELLIALEIHRELKIKLQSLITKNKRKYKVPKSSLSGNILYELRARPVTAYLLKNIEGLL